MNEHLAVEAEIEKLARLLHTDPDDLAFARALPSVKIHELAGRVSDTLHDAGQEKLGRLAAVSKLVPVAVAVTFARKYFGPLMAGRVAVLLDTQRAAELAKRLPSRFVAEISLHLDPRRAADIIARVPDDKVVAVGGELVAMQEFVTMGRFVGYVSHDAILRVTEAMSAAEMLRTAFFVDAHERFDEIVAGMSDQRLGELISVAAADDLWVEALSLTDALNEENLVRVANVTAAQDDDVVASMARSGYERELFDVILPIVRRMNDDSRRRLATLPALHEADILGAIVDTAARHDLWWELLPLADLLPEDAITRVAGNAAQLDSDLVAGAIHAAHRHQLWPALFTVAEHMDDANRSRLMGLLDRFEDAVIEQFVRTAASDEQLVDRAMRLLETAQDAHIVPVLKRIAALDRARRDELAQEARALGVYDRLGPIATALQG